MHVTCRLRELLESEKAQYMGESVTTQETALERQSRLRERARQLREKREAERVAFVEEKYEQQFRYDGQHVCNSSDKQLSTFNRLWYDERVSEWVVS